MINEGKNSYFGIGIEGGKTKSNFETLWRSAVNFGASYIFTIGCRHSEHPADTVNSWKKIPSFSFKDVDDFLNHVPYRSSLIGVEIGECSESLSEFTHPKNAIYILGPEDGNLHQSIQDNCKAIVSIDSIYCLNVAVAGSIVMYDRTTKEMTK